MSGRPRGPGRPAHPGKLVTCAFELESAQQKWVRDAAAAAGVSRSAVVREALRETMDYYERRLSGSTLP